MLAWTKVPEISDPFFDILVRGGVEEIPKMSSGVTIYPNFAYFRPPKAPERNGGRKKRSPPSFGARYISSLSEIGHRESGDGLLA